nr:type II toxin-antitoxin system death-on-curing family toxin [Haloterrigena sp. H1]
MTACGDCAPYGNHFGSCKARHRSRKPLPQGASASERVGWGSSLLDLHEQIVEEGDNTESGVRSEDAVASALQYVSEGFFGEVPQTIHEKAVQLMRLLVADHPFVDGNKRTALRTVVVFYMLNGYTFEYGDEVRALLHRFATDEAAVDTDTAVIYFRACARRN